MKYAECAKHYMILMKLLSHNVIKRFFEQTELVKHSLYAMMKQIEL